MPAPGTSRVKNRSQLRLQKRSKLKPLKGVQSIGQKLKRKRKKLFFLKGFDEKGNTKRTKVRTRTGIPIIKQQASRKGLHSVRISGVT